MHNIYRYSDYTSIFTQKEDDEGMFLIYTELFIK